MATSIISNYINRAMMKDYIKVVLGQQVTTTAGTSNYICPVDIPSGYKFVCNLGVYTSGFVSSASFDPLTKGARVFFRSGDVTAGWVKVIALCVKDI